MLKYTEKPYLLIGSCGDDFFCYGNCNKTYVLCKYKNNMFVVRDLAILKKRIYFVRNVNKTYVFLIIFS